MLQIKIKFIGALLLITHISFGQIKPAKIFSDNMILQREAKVPVWGKASPNEKITVVLDDAKATGVADSNGNWKVYLPEFSAGGPFYMLIKGDKEEVIFKNVLIGDVWFASGQSNMEHPIGGWDCIPGSEIYHIEDEIKDSNYPQIRLFHVDKFYSPQKLDDLYSGEWKEAGPESIVNFSSIGWFFGKQLHSHLKVPIGIINSSWGGSSIRTWMSGESLKQFSDSLKIKTFPDVEEKAWTDSVTNYLKGNFNRRMQVSYSNEGLKDGITDIEYDDSSWQTINLGEENTRFSNVVWIRKVINIPDCFAKDYMKLSLGILDRQIDIYFNGKNLGYFLYPENLKLTVPRDIVSPGENVIVVRIAQPWDGAKIWGEPSDFYITNLDGSFTDNIGKDWKFNDNLEPIAASVKGYYNDPSFLFNAMVNPIIPYGIKGFIWFQGSADAARPYLYEKMFQSMISDWRGRWEKKELPFLFMQLPNVKTSHKKVYKEYLPELREAQKKALSLPNTGMVVSIDIGDQYDVHPRNKKEFADRLVMLAKEKVYHEDINADSPVVRSSRVIGDTVVVEFGEESKLENKYYQTIVGFEIAGENGSYYPAKAELKDNGIYIFSDQVNNPVSVRYAWKDNPKCSLYGQNGLPVTPFKIKF